MHAPVRVAITTAVCAVLLWGSGEPGCAPTPLAPTGGILHPGPCLEVIREREHLTKIERRWTADGELAFMQRVEDGRTVSIESHERGYDDAGRLVRHELERQTSGAPDIEAFAYDDADRVVHTWLDVQGDGVWDGQTEFVYDEVGRLVREQRLDGAGRPTHAWTYGYDEAGDLVVETTPYRTSFHTYDDAGRRLRTEVYEDDVFDYSLAYAYEGGLLRRHDYDWDGDGLVDRQIWFDHDAAGRVVRESNDRDADGAVDSATVFAWDAAGRKTSEREVHLDTGTFGLWKTWTYDDRGRVVGESGDYDGDGVLAGPSDYVVRHRWDATGLVRHTKSDWGADGTIDRREECVHTPDDRLARMREENPHGSREERWTFARDTRGRVVRTTHEESSRKRRVERTTFADEGRRVRVETWSVAIPTLLSWTLTTRDERGLPVVHEEYDAGASGGLAGLRFRETWTHDEEGRPLRVERDMARNNAGVPVDSVRTWTYEDEGDGRVETERVYYTTFPSSVPDDVPLPAEPSSEIRREYDDDGHLLAETEWMRGAPFRCRTFEYDDRGRRIAMEEDWFCSGWPERSTWSYDAAGNVLEHRAGARVTTYDYVCF